MSKRTPYELSKAPEGTPVYWRSLEEKAHYADVAQGGEEGRAAEAQVQAARQVEFTPAMLEKPDAVGRRGFMSILGASMALMGAAGCRRPVEKIVPYVKMPEDVTVGVPNFYATVYPRRGDAVGLLVETHEGRPTKVEGNPDHPSSFGATDALTQASILDLYDPDRSGKPTKGGNEVTWAEVEKELTGKLKSLEADGGSRLRLLLQPTSSPSVLRLRGAILKRFPRARAHTYAAVSESSSREGTRLAFGAPLQPLVAYDRARVIVALDCDFLEGEPGSTRASRLFAMGRRLRSSQDGMNRLYVVESTFTSTGTAADHRLRLPRSQVGRFAMALAAELARAGVDLGEVGAAAQRLAKADGLPPQWLKAVAKDLAAARGAAAVVVGSSQPAEIHALVHAMNQAFAAQGSGGGGVVRYVPVADGEEVDTSTDIKALADALRAGQVDTLLVLGGNPVYDAPADVAFAEALSHAPFSAHLATHRDETSAKCHWHLPKSHEYEAWGDQRALDGTLSVQQPLIAPLRETKSELEILAMVADLPERAGLPIVQATFRQSFASAIASEHEWRRVLSDGIVKGSNLEAATASLRATDVVQALEKRPVPAAPSKDALELVFSPCSRLFDGRYANNAWLQEIPESLTKIVWDNAALLSPKTAAELGVKNGDVLTVSRGNANVRIAAWVFPGQADNTVGLALGWGRTAAGRVGNGKGFDVYPVRTLDGLSFGAGAKVSVTGEKYRFSQTQEHNSMEGRPIARETTLMGYKAKPRFAEIQSPPPAKSLPLWTKNDYSKGHRWGMSIDLNACSGCNACVVACYAENNITPVGKDQVARGRELAWLRIDRYFVGEDENDPKVAWQPMMCQQCEEAPCENVCPVNATAHSPEGLNDMAYNRCIGTRYCANNCPYKVRRFNYLDFKSEFWSPTGVAALPVDPPETVQMQYNPDVTVRMRGVMEKCTFCVQRIQRAKIKTKRQGRPVHDGEVTPACAQACSSGAIVFGDLNDPSSRVARISETDRRYKLLAEIGTAPRITYLGRVRNPNPELEAPAPTGAPATQEKG